MEPQSSTAATAYHVAYALAQNERDRLGLPPGDETVKFPDPRDGIEAKPAPSAQSI